MRIVLILCLTLVFQLMSGIPVYADGSVDGSFTVEEYVPPDVTPPSAVTNLSQIGITSYSVKLRWTAPGDDSTSGQASYYDIRYSTLPIIGEMRWAASNRAVGIPTPKTSGTTQTFTVTGLLPYTTYYFAMKTADEAYNWSPLSNCVSATTSIVYSQIIQDDEEPEPTSAATSTPQDVIKYINIKGKKGIIFLDLQSDGTVAYTYVITIYEKQLEMIIDKGTILLDKTGNPVSIIVLEYVEPYGTPPNGYEFFATYDFQPSCVIEPSVSIKIRYDRDKFTADLDENDIHIAYFNQLQNHWVLLSSTRDTNNQFAGTDITHFSLYSLIVPRTQQAVTSNETAGPHLSVVDLYLSANEIELGQPLLVNVGVLNDSNIDGEFQLPLLLDGETLSQKIVNLSPLEEKLETFSVVFDEEGTYSISVGTMQTTIIVKKVKESESAFLWLRTPLIWISLIGLSITLVVVLINRLRKKKTPSHRIY